MVIDRSTGKPSQIYLEDMWRIYSLIGVETNNDDLHWVFCYMQIRYDGKVIYKVDLFDNFVCKVYDDDDHTGYQDFVNIIRRLYAFYAR